MSIVDDIAMITGAALVAYGGYLVHPALCCCVLGVSLVAFGIGGQRLRRKDSEADK